MRFALFLLLLTTINLDLLAQPSSDFVKVVDGRFMLKSKPYCYLGANFWYGMNLGSTGEGGDRERLIRELDQLKQLGINNLRIMAASEGPEDQPWRMLPALQPKKGKYNNDLWLGLDFLLAEMAKRDMYAVVCLSNFWPWSGGMAQYIAWEGSQNIPYPPPAEGGDWGKYQLYTSKFYKNKEAKEAYWNHVQEVVNRKNQITEKFYKNDPTIMAWELANEPRGILLKKPFVRWVKQTASLIKSLDKNHLVTVGSEGKTPSVFAGTSFKSTHKLKDIDYTTIHIWIQNWGWYDPQKPKGTYTNALNKAKSYIYDHLAVSNRLDKPMVLEEFGIARDNDNHSPQSSTIWRDKFYQDIFEEVYSLASQNSHFAGCNFWAWGGEGRPRTPKTVWRNGDNFIGDPPHEYQGWYSIYDNDISTLEVIHKYTKIFSKISN